MSAQTLHIADKIELPAQAVTQTFAILAQRGMGKTYTGAVFAEELLAAQLRTIIIDPVGVWWGLRADQSGKPGGFEIPVLGGDKGDIPIEASAGELVAETLIQSERSAVIDLSAFRKGEQTRFMTAFLERVYQLNRTPLQLIVDEADAFAPQRPMPGEQRVLGAMEDIVRRGRARGIGCTLITQRPAVLSKNVLTQIGVLVCLRMVAPHDQKAIEAWVKLHGTPEQRQTLLASLASLPVGRAWFWSPGWLSIFQCAQVRKRKTFDSSATPEVGAQPVATRKLKPIDLEKLLEQMSAHAEEEGDKGHAKGPAAGELQARIKQLETDLAAANARAAVTQLPQGLRSALRNANSTLASTAEILEVASGAIDTLRERLGEAGKALNRALEEDSANSRTLRCAANGTQSVAIATAHDDALSRLDAELSGSKPNGAKNGSAPGKTRILTALAQCPRGLSARQLGLRAGLSSKSGTFRTYISGFRTAGAIAGSGDLYTITPAGRNSLGAFDPLPTGRDLLRYWLNELGATSGIARMLSVLADAYPQSLSHEETARRAGLASASGTFRTYLSRLRTLELVTGKKDLRAAGELVSEA